MTRLLVRAAQDPFRVYRPAAAMTRMGGNAGNLLYANAVLRTLAVRPNRIDAGAYSVHAAEDPSAWLRTANRRYDHYVVPLANAFRYGYGPALAGMTRLISRLDIPVTVVGVGAQTSVDAADPDLASFTMGKTGKRWRPSVEQRAEHDGTVRAFVDAVLERSASIGVRGPISKRYLVSLGIDEARVEVIGCPSLFTWGPDLRVREPVPLTADSAVSMNVDHRVRGIGAVVQRNTEHYPRMTSPVQDSASARMILTGTEQFDMARRDPLVPVHTGHQLFREGRLVYYPNPWGWIASFEAQSFAFGNRLHGNIAAILGGAPAHLLAHDSRTLELAEYHRIPHSLLKDFDEPPLAEELRQRTDFTAFHEALPERFDRYIDFLHRNGLQTRYDGQVPSGRFDRKIRAGQRVGPVRP